MMTTSEFLARVADHAGIDNTMAGRVTRAVMAAVGSSLSPACSELVGEELPPMLAAALRAAEPNDYPAQPRIEALGHSPGRAHELIASVCRVLADKLSHEANDALHASVPHDLAQLLVPSSDEHLPEPAPHRDTIAEGRPGSSHPVTERRRGR
ncbi:MAG: DUF2267 domain-containing protein [Kofleriaceae bacterium]